MRTVTSCVNTNDNAFSEDDHEEKQHWHSTADAIVEMAAAVLHGKAGCSDAEGAKLLEAALSSLAQLAPPLRAEPLCGNAAQLACHVLGFGATSRTVEGCLTQALQLLRALVRSRLLDPRALADAVPAVFRAVKDDAPSVDDLDEVSAPAQAARDCLRAMARMDALRTLPLIIEAARKAGQSADALDRAAAVHAVSFALCGARQVDQGWAVPLTQALGDRAIWVRQAACEGALMLAEALEPSEAYAAGLLLLLGALAEHALAETEPDVLRKAAEAVGAIFRELSSDEAGPLLQDVVTRLLRALDVALRATQQALATAASAAPGGEEATDAAALATAAAAACSALVAAVGAAATAGADLFGPLAAPAAAALLPLMQAGSQGSILATCLDAAGGIVASAWAEPAFRSSREEFTTAALRVLGDRGAPSEARASAHSFFACVALASFEEFAPYLPQVVPPAVAALAAEDGGEVRKGGTTRREVRTGAHEERVAAVSALGAYAAAVGSGFAAHLPLALTAVCAQATRAFMYVWIIHVMCVYIYIYIYMYIYIYTYT